MSVLLIPRLPEGDDPWPTLGPQVCDLIEDRCIFGPGSLKGRPAVLDDETRALIYSAYEVFPAWHERAGRRRFKRVAWSMRKGSAKTEKHAWVAFAELHREGPVRADGFDAYGEPVGRPVTDPYIPLLAYTEEQAEELVFGALLLMCTEGPDGAMFDAGQERILRLDERGRADGKAVALAGSPSARDGARTTMQGFDEPHRMTLPKQREAHETMLANIPKRPLEDPWSLYTTTAGRPGQQSVAEQMHREAQALARGEGDAARSRLFYFHRQASDDADFETFEGRKAAVREASSAHVAGFSDLDDIAEQWDRPDADPAYLERVWGNRWTQSSSQAFNPRWFAGLIRPEARILDRAFVTVGFDGARFRDSTALVVTEVRTGLQQLSYLRERPEHVADDDGWEVDPIEVDEAWQELVGRFRVWRLYADPPHWLEMVADWAGERPDQVVEWWTANRKPIARAVRAYREAIATGQVTATSDPRATATVDDFARHVGNAGTAETNIRDEDTGRPLVILAKLEQTRKFDAAMAAVLSWQARLDAIRQGAEPAQEYVPRAAR